MTEPELRKYVILGAPDDRGVAIVGGRVGAKEGPSAIRRELALQYGGASKQDGGDIVVQGTQEETYQVLRKKVYSLHKNGRFPILLGGGHDLSFGSLSGFLDAYPDGGIVNIDPHLDARPIPDGGKYASGCGYRLLLERGGLTGKRLMEFGFQLHCNAAENLGYLKEKGVHLVPWPADVSTTLRPFAESVSALAVSFDMDSIQSTFVPGVSAPAKVGYTADDALVLICAIQQFPNLKQFEIMELNPQFDSDGRSAKLAARLVATLMAG